MDGNLPQMLCNQQIKCDGPASTELLSVSRALQVLTSERLLLPCPPSERPFTFLHVATPLG